MSNAILLLSCPDTKGIVAEITAFVADNNGNIVSAEQYTDNEDNMFFMRLEWNMENFLISRENLVDNAFNEIADKYSISYNIYFDNNKPAIALYVTTQDHCLQEILWRARQDEFNGDISCIISNHDTLKPVADSFNIPFYYVAKTKDNRIEAEYKEYRILKKYNIELVILAKYMQIISDDFVSKFKNNIINIHHSFLPAFEGARPYHRAHERGVKLIGSTVHYVSGQLDKGPIIDQDVKRVFHKDSIEKFKRVGRDLEKLLLVRGLSLHLERRLLVHKNRTIVFE